jgi:hypothetical protein
MGAQRTLYDMLGCTPGTTFEIQNGGAKLLKGGGNLYLSFNIHYQTTGKPETDRSMLGFWFKQNRRNISYFGARCRRLSSQTKAVADGPREEGEGTGVVIPLIPPYAENYEDRNNGIHQTGEDLPISTARAPEGEGF